MKQHGSFEDMLAKMKASAAAENMACLGIGLPPNADQRIFDYVRENPKCTAEQVSKAVHISDHTTRQRLVRMVGSGLIVRHRPQGKGSHYQHWVPQ